jgi:predicted lipoprotein
MFPDRLQIFVVKQTQNLQEHLLKGSMKILHIATLAVLAALPAQADPATVARNFAGTFAIPRFQAVAAAAHAQQDAWTKFCGDRKRGDTKSLTGSFNDLADAWAKVEFVRIGPAAVALRVERFNWWLDRTNATGKALDALLAIANPTDLTPEKLATGSVAGQGLPIIERLLYEKGALAGLKGKDGAQRCAVGEAVGRGQSSIADAIVTDWTSPNGANSALAANTRWNMAFADAKEAASVMMTDLVAGLEGLKDLKVAMVFHDVTNLNAPKLSEGVRSGRTLRDISLNLAALREGLAVFLADASAADRTQLDKAFDDTQATLTKLHQLEQRPAERDAAVREALGAVTILSQTAMADLPKATGLTLGFNNLDGD